MEDLARYIRALEETMLSIMIRLKQVDPHAMAKFHAAIAAVSQATDIVVDRDDDPEWGLEDYTKPKADKGLH